MNNQSGGFVEWVKSHPMLMLLFVVVAIFGIIFLKKNQGSTSTSATGTTGAADLSGLSTTANGQPIIYRAVADEFVNITKNIGSYNPVTTSSSTNTSTSTVSTGPATPVEHPIEPVIIKPAAIGSLANTPQSSGTKNGVKDANSWIYTAPAGSTLTSLAQFAKWGTDYKKLENYRNNATVLTGAGVDLNNPYAHVPTGLQLSV